MLLSNAPLEGVTLSTTTITISAVATFTIATTTTSTSAITACCAVLGPIPQQVSLHNISANSDGGRSCHLVTGPTPKHPVLATQDYLPLPLFLFLSLFPSLPLSLFLSLSLSLSLDKSLSRYPLRKVPHLVFHNSPHPTTAPPHLIIGPTPQHVLSSRLFEGLALGVSVRISE